MLTTKKADKHNFVPVAKSLRVERMACSQSEAAHHNPVRTTDTSLSVPILHNPRPAVPTLHRRPTTKKADKHNFVPVAKSLRVERMACLSMPQLPGVYQAKKKNGTIYYRSSLTYRAKHISLGSYV